MRSPETYPFKMPPLQHQLTCWSASKEMEAYALFAEMGTGKSKILIDTFSWLYDQKLLDEVLVLAPKGVYMNWVATELGKHIPDHIKSRVGWWDASQNKGSRDSLEEILAPSEDLKILVMNIEAISLDESKAVKMATAFLKRSKGSMVVVDESTTIKNPTARRTKNATRLGRLAKYTRIACGDPYADSPLDVFAMFQFLKPGILGYTSFYAFRNQFAQVAPLVVGGREVRGGRVVGYKELEKLKNLVAPHAFFIKKTECLDLPPKVYLEPRHFTMLPDQKRAYDEMQQYSMAVIGEQLKLGLTAEPTEQDLHKAFTENLRFELEALEKGNEVPAPDQVKPPAMITASIVLTQLLRLQQIACGFAVDENGNEVDLCDGKNPRIAEMVSALRELGKTEKAIIWAPFRRSIQEVADALRAEFGPDSVVTFFGSTSNEDRTEAIRKFQDPNSGVRFFTSSQSTGGRGNTLTAATFVLYFSNIFHNELRVQSEDRAHRIGTTHTVAYQDMVGAPVDEKTIKALKTKKSISDMLRDGSWKEMF